MRDVFLPFSPPSIGDDERAEVMDTLEDPLGHHGPKTMAFEAALKAYLEAPSVVGLNSCTAGLHVGLVALGVGPGDEVHRPRHDLLRHRQRGGTRGREAGAGGRLPGYPELSTPRPWPRAITPRTKAILPVHYAGHPAPMDELVALAERHGLQVLEDAAHAISARYKGRLVGSRSNLAAFSFYATKNLTTVEGGCLTGDAALVEKARIIGHHGMNRDAWKRFDRSGSWYYEVVLPGFKYNMTDIQAASASLQLERSRASRSGGGRWWPRYGERLGRLTCLELPVERPDVESSWHLYVIRLRPEALRIDRNAFIEGLKARNIGTSVHYLPVHMHPFYRDKYGYRPEDNPVAAEAFSGCSACPCSRA